MFLRIQNLRLFSIVPGVILLVVILAACAEDRDAPTPTLSPTRTSFATATPISQQIAKARVAQVFNSQVEAIKTGDWESVYRVCSPRFRASRDLARYVQDAAAQFTRDGYTASGFEARSVEPFVRAPDRIRVRWEAYQDGNFVRTVEVGQIYVFTQGDWFDDGAWCR